MPKRTENKFFNFGTFFVCAVFLFLSGSKIASAAGLQWSTSYNPAPLCPTGYEVASSTIVAGIEKTDCDYSFLVKPAAPVGPILANITCCKEKAVAAPLINPTTSKKPFIFVDNPLFDLQVKIPGLEKMASETPATCTVSDDQTSCSLPWISIYIKAVYNYSMGIVGILAALALMVGGVIYLTSAGNASRISEAKSWISGALTGMLIMFTSYILLNEVNPDLIAPKPIELSIVQEMTLSDGEENVNAAAASNPSATPANVKENSKVTDISQCQYMVECDNSAKPYIDAKKIPEITNNIKIGSKVDARLMPATIEGLKKASKLAAAKGVKLAMNDGLRSQKQQCNYYFKANKNRALASPPGKCNSHMGGTSVDMAISGVNMSAGGFTYTDPKKNKLMTACSRNSNTKLLNDIMVASGAKRYCGEYWHFVYNEGQSFPCPGKGGHCTEYGCGKSGTWEAPGCTN